MIAERPVAMPHGRMAKPPVPSSRSRPASTDRPSITSSAPRPAACMRSADWAPSAACRISTISCSWRPRCRAIRSKAIASAA